MIRNIPILIIFSYILILIQTSFLVHFNFHGFLPNLILIFVIIFNLFEKPEGKLGLVVSFSGGFFLDIFSEMFLGFWILILLSTTLFIKFILKKYIQPAMRLGRKARYYG